jgi:hypothetical protein
MGLKDGDLASTIGLNDQKVRHIKQKMGMEMRMKNMTTMTIMKMKISTA